MPTIQPEPLPSPAVPALLATSPAALTVTSRFSQDLRDLARHFADRPARLAEILAATQGRGFYLLLLLVGLPFLTPIPLPGLSTAFGLIVLVIGARLALGQRPWLPEKLLQRELPARFIARTLAAAIAGSLAMLGAQVIFTYAPVMNRLFHSAPIAAESWLRIGGVAMAAYVAVELEKWIRFGCHGGNQAITEIPNAT